MAREGMAPDMEGVDEEWARVFKPPARACTCPHLGSLVQRPPPSAPVEDIARSLAEQGRHAHAGLLLPGLPNDLAMLCLARIPHSMLLPARAVCAMWRRVLRSEEFHKVREVEGTTGDVLCVCLGVQDVKGRRAITFEALDFRSHAWFQLPPLYLSSFSIWKPGGRFSNFSGFEVVSAGSKLLVLGGAFHMPGDPLRDQRRNQRTQQGSCDVWSFDTISYTWCALASMSRPRSQFAAAALDENRIIVAGSCFDASAEVLDLRTNIWTVAESMPYPGDVCRGIAKDGLFYAIWHRHPFHGARSAYVYDPQIDAWSTIPGFFPSTASLETSQSMAVLDGAIYATQGERQSSLWGELSVLRNRGNFQASTTMMPHQQQLEAMANLRPPAREVWKPIARLPRKLREQRGDEEFTVDGHFLAAVCGKLIIVQTVVKKTIIDDEEEIMVFGGDGATRRRLGFMSILSPPWWERPKHSDILAWEVKDVQISSGVIACLTLST